MISTYADLRRSVRIYWYRTDKGALVFVAFTVGVLASLACLARNVYFEARGEPITGQFAVAEVTMNRKASRLFPRTVCEVVYQKSWDPIRKRQVAAFSWTEFGTMPEPRGEEWQRAQQVARAVYYNRYQPQLQGALYFHATYIRPEWAKEKRRIARIGRHVFYR